MSGIKNFTQTQVFSFKHAFDGCAHVLRTQKNSWIHSGLTIIVVLVGLWIKFSISDWIAIILVIGLVWVTEFINTAIETLVDLVSPQRNPLAKITKDVSAAAVLIAATISVIIGILVLANPLMTKVQGIYNQIINIP